MYANYEFIAYRIIIARNMFVDLQVRIYILVAINVININVM